MVSACSCCNVSLEISTINQEVLILVVAIRLEG